MISNASRIHNYLTIIVKYCHANNNTCSFGSDSQEIISSSPPNNLAKITQPINGYCEQKSHGIKPPNIYTGCT